MVKVLVIYDNYAILAWLVGEPVESVLKHIENGYPELLEGYLAGTIKAVNIGVDLEDVFNDGAFGVADGEIRKII